MALNPTEFVGGHLCTIQIGTNTLPGKKWELSLKGNVKNVSNSRDGRKRIPGLEDADGSFDLLYDVGNDPTTTAAGGIKSNAVVTLKLYVDATHFYSLSAIVDEIGPGAEFEGELMFPVKFSLESGTVTYPVYTP